MWVVCMGVVCMGSVCIVVKGFILCLRTCCVFPTHDEHPTPSLPLPLRVVVDLNSLNLAHNSISHLDDDFSQLTVLTAFNLSYNRLTKLPITLGYCTALRDFLLEGNPVSDPPLSLVYDPRHVIDEVGEGEGSILSFYFRSAAF